ncbi:MAG TPA: Spy/CpxP family protein refolding chaperone [Thermoanaerobaculia bacterium]|nr:Spy/CpxP family protein refolding chaperone [Thermoanaerobaculia bacterium]
MSIRNVRRSVLVAAGIGALAVSGLFAGRLFAHQMGSHFAGGMAPWMFRHVARELDLSESQQAQIREILKTHADEIEARVQACMDARRALHQAVMAQPMDETSIRNLAQQVGTVHADGAVLCAKIRAEIWPILTPDQQQRLASFHGRMRQHGEDAMKSLDSFLRGAN